MFKFLLIPAFCLPALLAAPLGSKDEDIDFLSFIPKEFVTFIESLTKEEDAALEKVNITITGRSMKEILDDFFAAVKKESPSLEVKFRQLYDLESSKFAKLSPRTRAFFKAIGEEFLDLMRPYDAITEVEQLSEGDIKKLGLGSAKILQRVIKFLDQHEDAKKEIAAQWPELGRLFRSQLYVAFEMFSMASDEDLESVAQLMAEKTHGHLQQNDVSSLKGLAGLLDKN